MSLQPFNWSVVIAGRWNVAILTPAWVAKKVFELKKGTQVSVLVPADGISSYQIVHPQKKIRVVPDTRRLEIKLTEMSYEAMGDAMTAGVHILECLSETPVQAAGFNIYFQTDKPTPEMIQMYENKAIVPLADLGYNVTMWTTARALNYKNGILNVTIQGRPDLFRLLCNFHRESNENRDLVDWLSIPVEQIKTEMAKLCESLELTLEEIPNEPRE